MKTYHNQSYFQKLTSLIGVQRFWRRSKIYQVMWGEKYKTNRTKVLSTVKQRVRKAEELDGVT